MIRYLETFFRNRWIITIPALILLLSGSALVLTARKTYPVSARIWTERSVYLNVANAGNQYLTPAQVQAGRFREFIATDTFSRAIVDRTATGTSGSEAQKQKLVKAIQTRLQAWDAGEHSVVINFDDEDPRLAIQVVQVAVEEYNRISGASQNTQATSAAKFYQDRITQYEEQILPRSTGAVETYLEQHPELRRNLDNNAPRDPQLTLLQQEAERDRQQYQQYRQRLDEVLLQSDATKTYQEMAFRFVDPPAAKSGGGSIGKKKMAMYSGIGLGLSLGYVALFLFLATELDSTMRNPGDITRRLRVPVLDVIPDYTERRSIASRLRRSRRVKQQAMAQPVRS